MKDSSSSNLAIILKTGLEGLKKASGVLLIRSGHLMWCSVAEFGGELG
jgi:hypothetical protein